MKAEINMVVKNAREATDFYQALFGVNVLSKTDLEGNVNEGKISFGNIEVRVLDENKDYNLHAPMPDTISSMWLNIIVEDIEAVYKNAMEMGCISISPVTRYEESNAINAVFSDKFNHTWVLNQILE